MKSREEPCVFEGEVHFKKPKRKRKSFDILSYLKSRSVNELLKKNSLIVNLMDLE